ncbi:MAG TPA: hypothetical protein DD426_07905, partial [Clostridiaceae bacterium]|nr:hypothetical protein [Clostridiaceae bacterium]
AQNNIILFMPYFKLRIADKILSIAYIYEDSEAMLPSNVGYAVQSCSNYMISDGLPESYIKSALTLFRLTGKGSPFSRDMKMVPTRIDAC